MKEVRLGRYCKFQNIDFELMEKGNSLCRLIERKTYNDTLKKIGFHKYVDSIYILDINCTDIQSAYYVDTFCRYKGFKCQILGIKNNIVFLNPSIEYQSISNDYAKHGYDPQLEIDESEIDEIWEERTPIEGFLFDVESIVYLKKKEV